MVLEAKDVSDWWRRVSFSPKRRMGFYQDMANAVEAGIAPITAIERMRQVSQARRSLRWLVNVLTPVLRAAANGASFAKALQPWVPPEDAAMLSAGEDTGELGAACRQLTQLTRDKLEVRAALRRNLLPSFVMLFVVMGLMAFVTNLIGPQAKSMVPPEIMKKLDLLPSYIALGEATIKWGIPALVALLIVTVVVWLSLSRWTPDAVREKLDAKVPPYSLAARIQTVFFLISVSSMMRTGRTFRASVEQVQGFSAPWNRAYMRQMLARLRAGMPEVRAMQVGMLPGDVSDRLNFYALLPDFAQVMQEVARDSMVILLAKVEAIGGVIRIIMMLALAGFVVFTLASVYDMSDGIEKAAKATQLR